MHYHLGCSLGAFAENPFFHHVPLASQGSVLPGEMMPLYYTFVSLGMGPYQLFFLVLLPSHISMNMGRSPLSIGVADTALLKSRDNANGSAATAAACLAIFRSMTNL